MSRKTYTGHNRAGQTFDYLGDEVLSVCPVCGADLHLSGALIIIQTYLGNATESNCVHLDVGMGSDKGVVRLIRCARCNENAANPEWGTK